MAEVTQIKIIQVPPGSKVPDHIMQYMVGHPISATRKSDSYEIQFKTIIQSFKDTNKEVAYYFESDSNRPIGDFIKIQQSCCEEIKQ